VLAFTAKPLVPFLVSLRPGDTTMSRAKTAFVIVFQKIHDTGTVSFEPFAGKVRGIS